MSALSDANKILNFQQSQGITATLPDNIIRFRQICLKYGLSNTTTKDILIDKFTHHLNTNSIKAIWKVLQTT